MGSFLRSPGLQCSGIRASLLSAPSPRSFFQTTSALPHLWHWEAIAVADAPLSLTEGKHVSEQGVSGTLELMCNESQDERSV
jgi:hypothetical protein